MTEQNLLFSPDLTLNLLSKSSPSQLEPFPLKRSRAQPIPEAFCSSSLQPQQKLSTSHNNNSSLSSNKRKFSNKILLHCTYHDIASNLSHVPCKFYKQGTCTAGANCTFSHSSDLTSESAVCKYFVKGNCKFGTKCALLHTMSPYGTSASKTSNGNRFMVSPPSAPVNRRKNEQMMAYSSSSNHFDHRSFDDPFASSAPAVSLLNQFNHDQLWGQSPRNGNMISNDFIGLRSSPRESSDHLLGGSPFSSNQLSRSVQSASYNRQQQHQQQQQQHDLGYDLNDAMLPSSLNDLFTPRELQVRRVRQQETSEPFASYSPSHTASSYNMNGSNTWTSRDVSQQQWRVPFLTKSSQNELMARTSSDYENNNRLSTAAINIPGGGSSSSGTGSTSSYLIQQDDLLSGGLSQLQIQDDEVQFYMEDDEAVTYKDHKTLDLTNNHDNASTNNTITNTTNTTAYTFPSLISLPST